MEAEFYLETPSLGGETKVASLLLFATQIKLSKNSLFIVSCYGATSLERRRNRKQKDPSSEEAKQNFKCQRKTLYLSMNHLTVYSSRYKKFAGESVYRD